MVSKDIHFYRDHADECRALARLTDELSRRLLDMARRYDDRERETANLVEAARTKNSSSPISRPKDTIEPLTLSIKDAGRFLGLGRSTIYRLIGDRQLETVKIGNRTLIKTASMRQLVEIQD